VAIGRRSETRPVDVLVAYARLVADMDRRAVAAVESDDAETVERILQLLDGLTADLSGVTIQQRAG
jgi:hypothetical protein